MALKVQLLRAEDTVMRIETMEELFITQIQDLYDAEEQLVEALPKMAEASASPDLRSAFE